jgi:hypothetical protein
VDAGRRNREDASRSSDVPWRRCKRSTDGWMPSREEGVDCGGCFSWVEDPSELFESKSISSMLLSTTVLVADAMLHANNECSW